MDKYSKLISNANTIHQNNSCNDGYNDAGLFETVCQSYPDLNIKAYSATKDVGFNNHGCRNLMMLESETNWNMLMDIDVLLNNKLLDIMMTADLNEKMFYCFKVSEHNIEYTMIRYDTI